MLNKYSLLFVTLLALNPNCCIGDVIEYPDVFRDYSAIDSYHGKLLVDPYRWLEDPNSNETKNFVESQTVITQNYINLAGQETRNNLKQKFKSLWNYPKYSVPLIRGKRIFYTYNTGLQNQPVLYYQESENEESKVIYDPNEESVEGKISFQFQVPSPDGNILAYGFSKSGSDWRTVHFKNITSGELFPDFIDRIKFSSVSWTKDNKGVFYSKYLDDNEEKSYNADGKTTDLNVKIKVFYHIIGTDQAEDILITEAENIHYFITAEVSHDGNYLIFEIAHGFSQNAIYYSPLGDREINGTFELIPMFNQWDALYSYVTNNGEDFVFETNLNAGRGRIIKYNVATKNMKTLLEEHPKNTLSYAFPINRNQLVACYVEDVKHSLEIIDENSGKLVQKLSIPPGAIISHSGKKNDSSFYFKFESFNLPGRIYKAEANNDSTFNLTVYRETKLTGINLNQFETKQIFYTSTDGTQVPMYIVRKKGIIKAAPTLLSGYGGFNINRLPKFKLEQLIFIDAFDGNFALANIRGGGEYGKTWHDGGRGLKKQNVFEDFKCAAKYLINSSYTTSSSLVIEGGSNGGLLIGAVVNQSPELFGAAIARIGVLDMLKFNKFTIGYTWMSEYGNPDENLEDFYNLLRISPLHNILEPKDPDVQYPGVLVTTGDHDDRVVPSHSYKYIAQLQFAFKNSTKQMNPLLIRIDKDAGHGAGKPTDKLIDEYVDMFLYIKNVLKIPTLQLE